MQDPLADLGIGVVDQDLRGCCDAGLFASVASRKRPDRRDDGGGAFPSGARRPALDELETFQSGVDVAADLSAGEPGDFGASGRLQIGDGRHRQQFGRRQFGQTGVAQIPRVRRPDCLCKARLGAQLVALATKTSS